MSLSVMKTVLKITVFIKIAEGIYGCVEDRYEFTDSEPADNPLKPFDEYFP